MEPEVSENTQQEPQAEMNPLAAFLLDVKARAEAFYRAEEDGAIRGQLAAISNTASEILRRVGPVSSVPKSGKAG